MNDTIVVNQPRLTAENEQVITIPNSGELLIEGDDTQVNLFVIYIYIYYTL